jgi:hypothetical protein
MSTLKVTHLQNESNSAPSISISSAVGGGVTFAGISTFHSSVNIGGNLGIGTETPGSPLEVNGGSALDVATFNSHNADGPLINVQRSGTAIGFVGSGKNLHSATGSIDALALRSQAELTIATGGATERLRIDSDGKIGVGGAPAANWHSAASSNVIQVGSSVLFDFSAAQFDVGHNYYYDGSNYKFISTGYAERITFSKSDGSIRFWSLGTGSADATATVSERLRITSVGDVGVGVIGPEARLHVEENLSHSSTYYLNNDAHILIDNPSSDVTSKSVLKLEGEAAIVYGGGSSNLIFADRQNERLRIASDGNVGINKIAPADRLHVGGKIRFGNNSTYYGVIEHEEGVTGANIYTSADSGGHIFKRSTTTQAEINDTGIKLPAGAGINFSAYATSGNPSSNLLDDYEEGTWTPVMNKSGTTGTMTGYNANSQLGYYRKVGSLLYISFYMYKSSGSFGTGSNQWYVSGLPFSILTLVASGYQSIPGGYMAINGANYNFASGTGNGLASGVRWQANGLNGAGTLSMYGVTHNTNWTSGPFEVSGYGCLMTT